MRISDWSSDVCSSDLHSFDLLDNVGLTAMDLPTLRYLTQAGGRLAPEMVRKYGQWAHATGRRMFVLYGQTEAAPRMAYLPPDRLLANSHCIGTPVPGGTFQLVDADQAEERRVGQECVSMCRTGGTAHH